MPQTISSVIARKRDLLTHADKQIIADVLTWDSQTQVTAQEIEAIAIVHDIVWVKLTDNRAIPLHVETFRSIRRQQLDEQAVDDVQYVTQLETKLEIDACQPGIYRVWQGMKLIGLVRHRRQCNNWIAEPLGGYNPRRYSTSEDAIEGLLLSDTDCLMERVA